MVAAAGEVTHAATNRTMICNCLTGCGHVGWVSRSDLARDGRIVTPRCDGPEINIFIGEQTWREGISRLSYRHDGNYVILGTSGRLVNEGRAEPREIGRAFNRAMRVSCTSSVSNSVRHSDEDLRYYNELLARQNAAIIADVEAITEAYRAAGQEGPRPARRIRRTIPGREAK
jgi:hypothetical protein